MTVTELIADLKKQDQNKEVVMYDGHSLLNVHEVEEVKDPDYPGSTIVQLSS